MALKDTLEIKNPNAKDSFVAASIYHHNYLEDENDVEEMKRIIEDEFGDVHERTIYRKVVSPKRRTLLEEAAKHYERSLRSIAENPEIDDGVAFLVLERANQIFDLLDIDATEVLEPATRAVSNTVAKTGLDVAAKIYTSDPQNVHSTSLNSQLKEKLKKMIFSDGDIQPDRDRMITEIEVAVSNLHQADKMRALQTLDKIKEGNYISSVDANELDVLAMTWRRSHHPSNANVRDGLQRAVLDALIDSSDSYNVVCAVGRVSRLLESLTAIDNNESLSKGAQTTELIFNDTLSKCSEILNETAKELESSNNVEMRNYAKSFSTGDDVNVSSQTRLEFERIVREKWNNVIEEQKHLHKYDLERLMIQLDSVLASL